MLARESRLNKKSDIVKTIRYGRRLRTPYVLLYVGNLDQEAKQTRVTAVVGKKVHKSAVQRHKYQRWLREAARDIIRDAPPVDIVMVGLPPLKEVSSKRDLDKSLEPALSKLKVKNAK